MTSATKFLVAGGLYSTHPYRECTEVYHKNRRIGLGLMGVAEYGYIRGLKYGGELLESIRPLLEIYREASDRAAREISKKLGLLIPKGVRAIAPTGTISMLAGTTSGIEPLIATHYLRIVRQQDGSYKEFIVENEVYQRLPNEYKHSVESAHDLGKTLEGVERRLYFQSEVQKYVDQGISSTINLPDLYSRDYSHSGFGELLLKYLPHLRGVTVYVDGSRAGQPFQMLTPEQAMSYQCKSGVCGS